MSFASPVTILQRHSSLARSRCSLFDNEYISRTNDTKNRLNMWVKRQNGQRGTNECTEALTLTSLQACQYERKRESSYAAGKHPSAHNRIASSCVEEKQTDGHCLRGCGGRETEPQRRVFYTSHVCTCLLQTVRRTTSTARTP